ncbi:MAG: hypothetical protein Q9187_004109 [Circinaria calcarea]
MASTHCTGLGPAEQDPTGLEAIDAVYWVYSAFNNPDMMDTSLDEFLQFPIDQEEPIASAQAVEMPLSNSSAPQSSSVSFYSNPVEHDQLSVPLGFSTDGRQFRSASTDMGVPGILPPPEIQGDNLMPVSDAKVQPRRRIDPRIWEQKRDIIERLYQDNSLSDTIQIMKAEHGFHASEKAYKGKFKEWNVAKNLKYQQAVWMVAKAHRREVREGKKTTFQLRGVDVPTSKIERLTKASTKTVTELSIAEVTPRGVTYFTPDQLEDYITDLGRRKRQRSGDKSVQRSPVPDRLPLSQESSPSLLETSDMLKVLSGNSDVALFRGLLTRYVCKELSVDLGWHAARSCYATELNKDFEDFRELGTSFCCRDYEHAQEVLLKLMTSSNTRSGASHPLTLSRFFCLVSCVAARGEYNSVEVILDHLLMSLRKEGGSAYQETLTHLSWISTILARAYVAQSKFCSLERLVIPIITQAIALCGPDNIRVARLERMLLLAHTDGLSVDESGETLSLDVLGKIEFRSKDINTTLLLLELLRCRYEKMGKFEELSGILARMDHVLNENFKQLSLWGLGHLDDYFILTLVWSYVKQQRFNEAECWLQRLVMNELGSPILDLSFFVNVHQHLLCKRVFNLLLRKQGKLEHPAPFPGEETLDGTSLDETLTTTHPMFIELVKCLKC